MKVSSWSLSPKAITVLTQRQNKPLTCHRKVLAPKGKLSQEVKITPNPSSLMIKREFSLEIEDPTTTPYFSNNLVIKVQLETGNGEFYFTVQEGQDRFYHAQNLKPPYLEQVPHPNARSITDFYKNRMTQTTGLALTSALKFVLEKHQVANKVIPLHGTKNADPLDAVFPALNELQQQIIKLARI